MSVLTETPKSESRLAARSPNGRRPQVMYHRWESLLFLHWRVSPQLIQQTLPPGLTVDTFHGDAYLGISPFLMRNVRPIGLPAVPWLSFFQELNVRTYAFDRTGTPGVWFYSLNCNRLAAVLAARVLAGLPYFLAEMKGRQDSWIDYECRRLNASQTARYQYRGSGPDHEPTIDSLEFFLLERYYLFSYRRPSQLFRGQVSHAPYRYRDVEIPQISAAPAAWDGFADLDESPDHACVVDGFDVKIFAQEKV